MNTLRKLITTILKECLNEVADRIVLDYEFDESRLDKFTSNARKWNENDFVEEYVAIHDFSVGDKINDRINKGEEVTIYWQVKDGNGKNVYKNSLQAISPYKTVVADKDYGKYDHWDLILDNTKELQDKARKIYRDNKNNIKPKFNKEKTIIGYHASPNKFKQFRYGEGKTSGQVGAENGFFFFKEIKFANYYASVLKENRGTAFLYECTIKLGNTTTEKGENVGTGWGRAGWLESMEGEGFDTVIIENADTGYGVTDEIVVFDDDNIRINKVIKV